MADTVIKKLVSRYTAEVDRQSFDNAGRSFGGMADKLKQVGTQLTIVGGALSGVAVAVASKAETFQESINKIVGLVGVEREVVEGMKSSLQDIALETGKSLQDVTDGLYDITSAGFRGQEALDILRDSAKSSTAGLGEIATIANTVTSAVTAWGNEVLSSAEATDILANTIRQGKFEPAELASNIGRAVNQAAIAGVSFADMNAALATMSLTNSNASEGVTRFTAILTALNKPDTGQGASKILADMGLSFHGLRQQIKEEGLLAALETLKNAVEGQVGPGKDFVGILSQVVPNIRALDGILALTGENFDKFKEITEENRKSLGRNQEAFEAQQVTMDRFKNALEILAINIGTKVLPTFDYLARKLEGIVKWFGESDNKWADFTARIITLGPLLVGVGLSMNVISVALKGFAPLLRVATFLQWGWNAAMAANPVGAIVIGVTALITGITTLLWWLQKKFDWIGKIERAWYQLTGQTEKYNESLLDAKKAELELLETSKERLGVEKDINNEREYQLAMMKVAMKQDEIAETKRKISHFEGLIASDRDPRIKAQARSGLASYQRILGEQREELAVLQAATPVLMGTHLNDQNDTVPVDPKVAALQAEIDALKAELERLRDKKKDGPDEEELKRRIRFHKDMRRAEREMWHDMEINISPDEGAPLDLGPKLTLDGGQDQAFAQDASFTGRALGGIRRGLGGVLDAILGGKDSIGKSIAQRLVKGFAGARDKFNGLLGQLGLSALPGGQILAALGITPDKIFGGLFRGLKSLFGRKKRTMQDSGRDLIGAFKDGLDKGMRDFEPIKMFDSMFYELRRRLPSSDAEIGHLSDLTASGEAFATTLAAGIQRGMPELQRMVNGISPTLQIPSSIPVQRGASTTNNTFSVQVDVTGVAGDADGLSEAIRDTLSVEMRRLVAESV